ncbi:MFS transporter [Arthrobacter sp. CJ23]|uniref:MFS transporter n=1 Tax=Arthrobacter sp. CJ23 TaxID=2972479 RepID=UPI00215B9293|nr:MFS transporter [Arthrobacter sp. CJ23]UVJ39038.1 MFS transporter [Arthrobacter sp. CJ23]
MATKRRRSSSAGAAVGCGPVLALVVIGLLIQYWWVLLIALGVVALTVALVRFAMAPPRPARVRPLKSARPSKPPPVMTPPSPALVNDDLADQMRAIKHVRHIRDMQEWDYEWIRLTNPEKSSRELGEIANAHFARGRSIGINYGDPSVPWLGGPSLGQEAPSCCRQCRDRGHHEYLRRDCGRRSVLDDELC